MFREFNVKFEDVEMLGGADNLLEGTEITKVIVRGDNNKMSSLDSMLKNCNELDTIDGELDLNGVGDIDNLLEGTELVKSINLKNINNENISANNSFPHVEEVTIGGELYNKKAMQNVIASKDWTFDNINYSGTVGDNIVTKEVNIVDDNKATIQDTLEQKARGIEIIGQTYENLVVGSGEATLLDELTLESVDGSPNEFTPHIKQPVCVETIEGETYQNLIEGKGEYKLTDTFSTTWTESNNSIENPPSMIEIPEIFGNTVQGFANCVTTDQIVTSLVNTINSGATDYVDQLPYNNRGYLTVYSSGLDINDYSLLTDDCFIQLKPSTTYSYNAIRVSSTQNVMIHIYSTNKRIGTFQTGSTFTTDSTGKVIIYPLSVQNGQVEIKLVEGKYNLTQYSWDYDLNYIESVGDLYTDSEGTPILDEDENEQYKLDIISHGYAKDIININNQGEGRNIAQNIKIPKNTLYTLYTRYIMTPKVLFHIIAKIDFTQAQSGYFYVLSQGGSNGVKFNKSSSSLILVCDNTEYILGSIKHNEPFMFTHRQTYDSDTKTYNLSYYLNGTLVLNIPDSSWGFQGAINLTFNSYYHTEYGGGCNGITVIYAQNATSYSNGCEEDWDKLNQWNKTTILMPCQLSRIKGSSTYDVTDKLLFNKDKGTYIIEKNINTHTTPTINYTGDLHIDLNLPIDMIRSYNNINNYPFIIEGAKVQGWSMGNLSEFAIKRYNNDTIVRLATSSSFTNEEISTFLSNKNVYYVTNSPQTVETKILEKPSLETYSPKTYITTSTEIQPSQMTVTNKKVDFIPLGLQANKDYTLQLDSIGKNDKPITVNLGGAETTIQPINDTSKHHKVVVRTPSTLTTDKLDLSGEGVVVNDVMLFEGGGNEIKQDVEYVEGIQNIGELTLCKNLFDKFSIELFIGNLNYLTGAELENSEYMRTDYIEILPNKTYTLSGFGDSSMDLRYTLYNDNKSFNKGAVLPSLPITTSFTFTTDSTSKYLRIAYNCSNMDTLQLEEGIVATDYQEYFEGERYKIDTLTTNGVKNLVNTNPNNWIVKDSDTVIIKSSIKVNKGKTYTVFNSMGQWVAVYESDWNGNQYNLIGQDNTGNWSFVATSEYIKVSLWNISHISDKLSQPHNMNVRIFEGYNDYGYNGYEERKLSTQSILLPQPLNKIGEIKDKFYWDDNKGHYCIEQNILKVTYDGSSDEDWIYMYAGVWEGELTSVFRCENKIENLNAFAYKNNIKCSSFRWKKIQDAWNPNDGYDTEMITNESDKPVIRLNKDKLSNVSVDGLREYLNEHPFDLYCQLTIPDIIDLPHLNKKYSLDTYMPTTYLECTNSPMQPSRLLLESDTVRYKPSALETDTDYTIQFECKEKSDKKVKLNLGGAEKEVDAEVGLNHVSITTPSEIDTSLYKDRLFLSGAGNKVADVIVNKGEMNQYPEYFDGVQSVGELQDDGTYKIDIETYSSGGDNLLSYSNFVSGHLIHGNVVSPESTVTHTESSLICDTNGITWRGCSSNYIEIDPTKKYFYEYTTSVTNLNIWYSNVSFYDESKIYISNITTSGWIDIPSNAKYLKVCYQLGVAGTFTITNMKLFTPTVYKVPVSTNNPLAKGDKLYWNKSNKRYEIDRGGSIEIPTVSGDVIDLPRLYQREDTHFSTSTGNIKPSKIKLDYNDLD